MQDGEGFFYENYAERWGWLRRLVRPPARICNRPSECFLLLLFETLELFYQIQFERYAYRRTKLKRYIFMCISSSVPSLFYYKADCICFLKPLRYAQNKVRQIGLHSKVVKFNHFEIRVMNLLPCTKKLNVD